jgi:cell fate regulator YaaT (PSP1 superfamily)
METNYIVRYGATRNVGEFSVKGEETFARSDAVVIRTDRGTELGEVLCPADEKTKEYLGGQELSGRILRHATREDHAKRDEVYRKESEEFVGCQETIRERNLQMQLVDVEHLLGGERIVFYYLAEQRVDFRELVKALAKRYQTRIEMRQIGVRDEARLLADYEHCGRQLCCKNFIKNLEPVTMKMAKSQKATLDPAKISGRCGRLMCCLRFEDKVYEELKSKLPKKGTRVVTPKGKGEVVDCDVLLQLVRVELEGKDERIMIPVSEILRQEPPAPKKDQGKADDDSE